MSKPLLSKLWCLSTSLAVCAAMMALVLLLLLPATQPPSQQRFIALPEIFMCLVACVEIVFGVLWLRDQISAHWLHERTRGAHAAIARCLR